MEEVDRTVNHMQDEAANFPDPADRETQEEEFSIELRTEVERFELSSAIVPYRLSITSKPGHPRVCSHFLSAVHHCR